MGEQKEGRMDGGAREGRKGGGKKEQMGMCSGEEDAERRLDEQAARRARALSQAVRAELAEGVPTGHARRVAAPDAARRALLRPRRRAMVLHRDVARVVRA